MPIYQYSCENKECSKSKMVMEYVVPLKMFDTGINCPKCGKPLVKMLAAPFFKIK